MSKTSKEIFEFQYLQDYKDEDMFPILRVFIHSEYEHDPTILERLKSWLSEMKRAKENLND
jgi:hypothetical protein